MKKQLLLTRMLLLVALLVGSVSAWGQSDQSTNYSGNISVSGASVTIGETNYNAGKYGTGKSAGSTSINVPSGTKYLHLHVAGWNGESVTLSITPNTNVSPTSISLTSDSNIQGSGTTYNVDDSKCATDYYKVVTFTNVLASNTSFTFSASSGKRFVIWGVYAEAESSDPSSAAAFTNTTPEINYPATKTYSQEPTTADGYNGNITYEITANTAGATINGETGLVTVTKGGSVTVKATAPAITGFKKSEATYTLTVNDTRAEAGLAWSAASASINYDETPYNLPTLTNSNSLAVTYSSTNASVATIDENTGQVSVKNVTGNTTISAIFAGNDDYKDQTVTYTLNVTKGVYQIIDGVFDFDEAGASNPVINYSSGVTPTSTGSYYEPGESTWTAGNVTMVVSGKYRWWESAVPDYTLRLYSNTPKSACEFSVPDGYYITKIVTTGGNFVTASTGTLSTSTWTGVSQSVKLSIGTSTINFKKITVTYTPATYETPAVTAAGWGTYVTTCPVSFEEGDAYVVSAAGETTTLKSVTSVPVNTPVLLKDAGAKTVTVVTEDVVAPESNLLKVSDGNVSGDDEHIYVLARRNNVTGFYLWDSAASAIPAGKVYLDTTGVSSKGIEYFSLDDSIIEESETNGIKAATVEGIMNGQFYNLAGQRVSNPTKGLYIVNGKKVIIK